MKKTLLIFAIIMASVSVSFAQKAIGLRWGMNSHLVNGMGTELSYQQALDNNRLEIDFGVAGIFGHAVDKITRLVYLFQLHIIGDLALAKGLVGMSALLLQQDCISYSSTKVSKVQY
jgi:hypothetical protein